VKKWFMIALLLIGRACYAQSATINWSVVHQVIDGFGGSDAYSPLTSSQQTFFFGTNSGDLGLSILHVPVPDNGNFAGVCTSAGSSCVSASGYTAYITDMQAAIADAVRIYASSWSPPPAYKTNGAITCSSGNGALTSSDYGAYATWLANYVESLQSVYGISVYALSVQNEPNVCASTYDSALWSAANFDTFIKTNLGPTFASDSLSTLIFMPETGGYADLSSYGGTCATDSSCASYLSGVNWHDYDATVTPGTFLPVNSTPYPTGWPAVAHYWETEVSCIGSAPSEVGPNLCESGFTTDMSTDGLMWAAIIDDRMAVENANAWLYWWLVGASDDNEGLICGVSACTIGTVAQRAYVLGQYARFVRPGYYRIDATHIPQAGVTVSAYQNTPTGTLVVVATNYTSSGVSQVFSLANAPTFTSVTPYITSASQNIQQQAAQSVSSNSFTYTLPADSVTTFVGTSSGSTIPAPPTNLSQWSADLRMSTVTTQPIFH
jgi:glucuronoarabinoxylan endo-1,4-beta-xylanase